MINSGSGIIIWRPLVTQMNTTNPFTMMMTDNGTLGLSATQNFAVTVISLAKPVILTLPPMSGQLVLRVNGDNGPDYQIRGSTNLMEWNVIFTTNAPVMPFVWTNNHNSLPANFFRVLAGPPFQ